MPLFALIGCGHIAQRHAAQIARLGTLVAVCDVDAGRLEAFAAQWGGNAYTHIDDLLQQETEVEWVVVCTPNGLHAEHAIKSLQARKHVLCEKPLSLTIEAAMSMADTAHFFRRKLFVVQQNRFNAPVFFVKDLLQRGSFGKLEHFDLRCHWHRPHSYYTDGGWHGTAELDGGTLFTQFSHFIDLLQWLLGPVEDANGWRRRSGTRSYLPFEDSGGATLTMQGGVAGTLSYTINAPLQNREGSLTLFGDRGAVRIGGTYLNTIDWVETHDGSVQPATEGTAANDYGTHQGSASHHARVYDELLKAIAGQPHGLTPAREAAASVQAILKIYAHSPLAL